MVSDADVHAFLARQRVLLTAERAAESARSALLLTQCGPTLLAQKGLALLGLGVVNVNVGMGGKTLVELERPSAYHPSVVFPPHTLRPGDMCRIEENSASTGANSKKASKAKKGGSTSASASEGKSTNAAEGVVYKVSDTRIIIAVDPSHSSSDDLDLPDRLRVVKLANSVTYDRMDKALDNLERTIFAPSGSENNNTPAETLRLARALLGLSLPSPPMPLPAEGIKFFDASLNDSQRAAVRFALGAAEVACIHGPPGTGKTHTLVEIIRQLLQAHKRLLVCGASNLAVDNLLERLLALPPSSSPTARQGKIRVTRVGHPARVMAHEGVLDVTLEIQAGRTDAAALVKDVKAELEETLNVLSGKGKGAKGKKPRGAERRKMWEEVKVLRKEYRQREGGIVKTVVNDAQVVLATCHTAGSRQLHGLHFDAVIIDEATQALEAVCWIPILKSNKLILAGDPMQLPPTVLALDEVRGKKSKTRADAKTPSKDTKKSAPDPPEHSEDSEDEEGDEGMKDVDDTPEPMPGESKPRTESKASGANGKQHVVQLKPPRTLETTLFERLEKMYGPGIKRMLQVQYRMHEQICTFPSTTLYASRLKSHSSVSARLLTDLPSVRASSDVFSEEDKKEVLGTPVVFFDTAGCEYFERLEGDTDEGSRCNENEAVVVKGWVDRLVEMGVTPDEIAVITPYQAQVSLLSSLLRPIHGPQLEIGSVDGMQGREKDAVVISLVRSNDKREVGFLKEKRRLNVAMTRAKRHLCVVGDSSTVQHGSSYLKKWMAWLEANADVRYAGLE